ncbi:MAG: nicotinate (nicotinamide) nucleotide adenylyltransferase [Ruminococcaceae bacterium]|nr:nicotinate (nicotinamide) nucleotide adenylyltransferase [Oscillospiraceae bacterium]
MKRIGLFGGMFDPVHLGHLHAAREAAQRLSLDKVIFIPANVPPHKKNGCFVAGKHRFSMLQLAMETDARFAASAYELEKEGTSYSYLTVEHFKSVFPADKLYFLIGDEAYALLHTWKMPERIRAAAEFVVVTREGTPPPQDALYVSIPKVQISSTEVRAALAAGTDVKNLLPGSVADYIEKNGLYRGGHYDGAGTT